MFVAGIDGTKGGWVAIALDSDGRFSGDYLMELVESSFNELSSAEVIAVDVPIGFGPRDADRAARAYLSGAASTVFSTPPREVLERRYGPGLGVSAQAHALGRGFCTSRAWHVMIRASTKSIQRCRSGR